MSAFCLLYISLLEIVRRSKNITMLPYYTTWLWRQDSSLWPYTIPTPMHQTKNGLLTLQWTIYIALDNRLNVDTICISNLYTSMVISTTSTIHDKDTLVSIHEEGKRTPVKLFDRDLPRVLSNRRNQYSYQTVL